MLHIAPEPQFEKKFRHIPKLDYFTLDLSNPRAGVKADITDIPYSDNSFDIIYCSHVLEHVVDDRKALRELNRVLKADGWAVILVPIVSSTTFENLSVTEPEERERVFGEPNHVRLYGSDSKNRLEESGFTVTSFSSTDIVDKKSIILLGVKQEKIFFCKK
jgi:ubiquinone/menaquinone biosynthesis C-methylase UbiE